MGFAEPGRSPGLLVSSYLTVSPLPRPGRREAIRTEAVYFLWHFPYPDPRSGPGRWALPTIAPCGVRTFLRGTSPDGSLQAGRFPSRPWGFSPGATAIIAPATNSRHSSYGPGFARTTRGYSAVGPAASRFAGHPGPSWAPRPSPSGRRGLLLGWARSPRSRRARWSSLSRGSGVEDHLARRPCSPSLISTILPSEAPEDHLAPLDPPSGLFTATWSFPSYWTRPP